MRVANTREPVGAAAVESQRLDRLNLCASPGRGLCR
jgi:hypothetical protein